MNNIPFYTILVISLLITIIIIYFIASVIRYHRQYIQLQKERIFAEITMQENERKRIATDLHDSLGPLLSTVKLNINSIDTHDDEEKEIINKAGKYLDEIIRSIRQISYNLLPNTLERKGLIEAIKEFSTQLNEKRFLKIEVQVTADCALSKEKEVHIFRMLQEIMHNTIKHANAKHLQIALSCKDEYLLILTKDNGVGFDVEKIKSDSGGLGLKSIESRAEILNSQLTITSKPGAGTSYFLKIPII
ncbi:MAG: sensor histidine kinase [Chitinophagaceae bacterium]